MADIVPAVIPTSLAHLRETAELVRGFARALQIDVVDGKFVPHVSWPYGGGEMHGEPAAVAEFASALEIEMDLMLAEPEASLDAWAAAGAARIVVHIESVRDMDAVIAHRRTHGYRLGLALNNDTPLSVIEPHLSSVDFVECMGIAAIGAQGAPFDERVIGRIAELARAHPGLEISVDGSVNETTLPRLAAAGATRFVAGSAIFKADAPARAYERLVAMKV